MIKISLYVLFIILIILYLGHVKITFTPFSFKLESWRRSVGWVFLCVGLGFLLYDQTMVGYKEGYKDCIKDFEIELNKIKNKNIDTSENKTDVHVNKI